MGPCTGPPCRTVDGACRRWDPPTRLRCPVVICDTGDPPTRLPLAVLELLVVEFWGTPPHPPTTPIPSRPRDVSFPCITTRAGPVLTSGTAGRRALPPPTTGALAGAFGERRSFPTPPEPPQASTIAAGAGCDKSAPASRRLLQLPHRVGATPPRSRTSGLRIGSCAATGHQAPAESRE